MAKRNHTRDTLAPANRQQDRFLTVTMYPEPRPRVPWIRMRGKWLARAGFNPDTRIRVRVMEGCLVITADAGDDE
jgi:toxic protein SymE